MPTCNVQAIFARTAHEKLHSIQSDKFYLLTRQDGGESVFFTINIRFFTIAFNKMSTEPLLRIYITNMSQNDPSSKIIFDQVCANVTDDMNSLWFVDLSSEQFMTLYARFENSDLSESQLKDLNKQDLLSIKNVR